MNGRPVYKLEKRLLVGVLALADEVLDGQQVVAHQQASTVGLVVPQGREDGAVLIERAADLLLVELPDRSPGDEGAVGESVDQGRERAVVCALGDDVMERDILGDDRRVVG